jgi:hypothetical protein
LVHVSTTRIKPIGIMVVDEFSNQNQTFVDVRLIASDVTHRVGLFLHCSMIEMVSMPHY